MGGEYLVWERKENFRGFHGIDLANYGDKLFMLASSSLSIL